MNHKKKIIMLDELDAAIEAEMQEAKDDQCIVFIELIGGGFVACFGFQKDYYEYVWCKSYEDYVSTEDLGEVHGRGFTLEEAHENFLIEFIDFYVNKNEKYQKWLNDRTVLIDNKITTLDEEKYILKCLRRLSKTHCTVPFPNKIEGEMCFHRKRLILRPETEKRLKHSEELKQYINNFLKDIL